MKSAPVNTQNNTHIPIEEYEKVYAQMAALQQQVDWFKRQLFGRKSEKHIIDNPDQASLFGASGKDDIDKHPKKQVKGYTRSTKQKSDDNVNDKGLRFTDDVPKTIIDVPCPELEGKDAGKYEIIGTKETYRLAQQIGSYHILVYRTQVVKDKTNHTLFQSSAPTNVLEGCYADVSLLAGLMVDKAVYHLPLYRQHQRMLDAGVTLSRATLTNYVKKGIELLRPIAKAMLMNMLAGKHLALDEVPMKAGRQTSTRRTGHKVMKQTYFWPIYGEQDEVAFTWSHSRGMQHALTQLQNYQGTLLTDGYVAYERVVATLNKSGHTITHANCWAHCRRTFEKALDSEPTEAEYALAIIKQLYDVETHIREKGLNAEQIQQTRLKHSEPIVHRFFAWIYEQRQRTDLLPKDPFSKALKYALDRQATLTTFLSHPQVSLDTNHLERALRVIPMGRKNHLFCWTELGAEQLGILHSLTVTCRLHGINPYVYLVDVLQRVSQHPAKDVAQLTPRQWKQHFSHAPLTSDVRYVS